MTEVVSVEDRLAGAGLGRVTGIAAVASWRREDSYYARSPWAGRRSVAGRAVIDGALVNPLAHAVMQALAGAAAAGAGRPRELSVERYRTRPIEVEDTAFARITFATGLRLVIAVTLAGEDFIPGEIIAQGTGGRAVLEYPTDRLALPGDTDLVEVPGRTDLLANLVAHRLDKADLLVPLESTADFTAVLEALTAPEVPAPHLLDGDTVRIDGPVRTIPGINALLRQVADTGSLPWELGVPWSRPPYTQRIPTTG